MPNDRAKQFMPFNSLDGYFELLTEAEQESTPKRERTEDEDILLNQTIMRVKKGRMVRITFYDEKNYQMITGMVSHISLALKTIGIVKKEIRFEDILKLEILEEKDAQQD